MNPHIFHPLTTSASEPAATSEAAMARPSRTRVEYNRERGEFEMYLDDELVGFARTQPEAELTLEVLLDEVGKGEREQRI